MAGRQQAGERGLSGSNLSQEISCLNNALTFYAEEHPSWGLPTIKVMFFARDPLSSDYLTSGEFARLLWAARGRVWEEGGWRRVDPADPRSGYFYRGAEWRARMLPLVRLMILVLYSGSRIGVILRLRWKQGPHHGTVVLETGRVKRLGYAEAAPKNKKAPTGRLTSKALGFVRRWARMDAAEQVAAGGGNLLTRPIVHVNGAELTDYWSVWNELRDAAGLGPDPTDPTPRVLTPYVLRHTCAAWAVLGGASLEDVAQAMGHRVETLVRHYLPTSVDFARGAATAMDPALGGAVARRIELRGTSWWMR